MKEQKKYTLEEAVKNFHVTKPLKIDLATKVADTVFAKREKTFPVSETWLYAVGAFLIIAGIIYSFSFLISFSVLSGLSVICAIILYLSLSLKEYRIMSKKLLI